MSSSKPSEGQTKTNPRPRPNGGQTKTNPQPRPNEGQTKTNPQPRPTWSVARLIYTGLGLGWIPKAPGTFGTLLGLPLYWLMKDLHWAMYLALTAFVFLLGWWASLRAEEELASHDAPEVVIDEVAGYLVTMFWAPALPLVWLWGFVFFRFFDILKPWPVSWADKKIPGALGIMFDDVLAGLYAWLMLYLVYMGYVFFS